MPLPRFRDVKIAQPQPANMLLQAREDERRTQNALQNRRRVDMRGNELDFRKEQFGYNKDMQGKEFKIKEEEHQFNIRKGKILEAAHYLPSVTQENYGDWVAFQEENGLYVGSFKSPEEVLGMAPEEFGGYKTQLTQNAQSLRDMDYLKAKTQAEKDLESQRQGNRINVIKKNAELRTETPGKPQSPSDKLKQQEFDAKEAFLNDTATDKQKKLFGLTETGKEDPKIKAAQDLYKHFTRKTSDSAGVILAKIISGQLAGDNEISDLGSENELNPADQALFEKTVKILSEYYGVDSQPTPAIGQPSPGGITHDFIPGKGLVPRTQ